MTRPNIVYYDADWKRHDCNSCGSNVQTLTNGRCAVCVELSASNCPLNRGEGVQFAGGPRPGPRRGGLLHLCTDLPHGGV